tara:strand:- start:331 stop:627 length:297 start_codon:yes stop_codon:yes gene_type:complete
MVIFSMYITSTTLMISALILRITYFPSSSKRVYAIRQRQERFVYARAISQFIASRVCLVGAFASREINQREFSTLDYALILFFYVFAPTNNSLANDNL